MVLHEQLLPYIRAAALTARRTGLPIMRPLCLTDPGDSRGWTITDAYGFGPALWVAAGGQAVGRAAARACDRAAAGRGPDRLAGGGMGASRGAPRHGGHPLI
ncbi:MAG TPA: hypothetical protein VGH67_15720 [Solirubrobacteraceae bacterium]